MKPSVNPMTETESGSQAVLRALWDIQSGFLRKSAYLQFSLAVIGIEGGIRQWRFWSTLAERDALIAGQKEIAEAFQPRLTAVVRESGEMLHAWSGEVLAWMLGGSLPEAPVRREAAPRTRTWPAARRRKKRA